MQVVNRDLTHTTVTSSPNPSTGGEQVTITASVAPAGPPTGTVGFTSNGTAISGCTAVTLSFRHGAVRFVVACRRHGCHRRHLLRRHGLRGQQRLGHADREPVAAALQFVTADAVPRSRHPQSQRHLRRPGDSRQHRARVSARRRAATPAAFRPTPSPTRST